MSTCAHEPERPLVMADVIDKLGPITEHRASGGVCPQRPPRPRDPKLPSHKAHKEDLSAVPTSNCSGDEDCTDAANGHCVSSRLKGSTFDVCYYDECYTDADCRDKGVCDCSAMQHHCVVGGNCRLDADCGAGRWCAPSVDCADRVVGYFCRTLADTCWGGDFCAGATPSRCAFDAQLAHWACRQCGATH
ncbi:MAG TPA: hypothetical protein VFF06_08980 [Polyangia bacterium]|nr:hypothetical protein [Polyangia bacterium]